MADRKFFGMVSTAASERYTVEALKSFAAVTKLRPGDRFVLIDNDASIRLPLPAVQRLETITHDAPKGFAANLNLVLRLAREEEADVFFLNNDLIFTKGWLDPLAVEPASILSPVSNAEVEYSAGKLSCRFTMDLEDYLGCENELDTIAARHRKRARGYVSVFSLPFFCVKLPYVVHSVLGDLDESFGPGGGEDKDYCIRALLRGFSVQHALGSYVIHFQGKSTWRGPETTEQTAIRNQAYIGQFRAKWGDALTRLFIFQDEKVVAEMGLDEPFRKGHLAEVVRALSSG